MLFRSYGDALGNGVVYGAEQYMKSMSRTAGAGDVKGLASDLNDDNQAIKYAQDKFAQQQTLASKAMSRTGVAVNNLDGTTIGNPQSGYRRLNASDITTIYDAAADSAGKAYGASKLLPAKALQEARVIDIMSSRNLDAARDVIKSPTAKSAMAMAEAGKNLKWVPYLGKGVTAYEEGGRLLKANGMVETSNVMAAATVNYAADTGATTGSAWAGATTGASFGSLAGPVGTVVGGVVGGVIGAFTGHYLYDNKVAPEVRVKFAGEKFRE